MKNKLPAILVGTYIQWRTNSSILGLVELLATHQDRRYRDQQ